MEIEISLTNGKVYKVKDVNAYNAILKLNSHSWNEIKIENGFIAYINPEHIISVEEISK